MIITIFKVLFRAPLNDKRACVVYPLLQCAVQEIKEINISATYKRGVGCLEGSDLNLAQLWQ